MARHKPRSVGDTPRSDRIRVAVLAPRLVGRDGRPTVRRIGMPPQPLRDLYFSLLRMPWPWLIPFLFAMYLAVVMLFALLYAIDPDSVGGVRPNHFSDVFFFSVETLATIGYGAFLPKSFYGHVLMTVEAFVGMLAVALLTGLAFAKFSRPTVRVIFSNRAVISRLDGRPTLMVRMANGRASQIAEAQVRLTLLRDETTSEGQWMRRFHDLTVVRGWTPVFALTWTVMHVIDAESPLHGATPESLAAVNAEIVVTFIGVDETLGQSVQARFSYLASELVWNARFADVISQSAAGREVNYADLHHVVSLDDA